MTKLRYIRARIAVHARFAAPGLSQSASNFTLQAPSEIDFDARGGMAIGIILKYGHREDFPGTN